MAEQRYRSIGQLSKAAGVKVTTIRYYESVGLLAEPQRSASGQRRYDPAALERLRFIRHCRELGFPTEAIRALIALQLDPGDDCDAADAVARRQLAHVRARIDQLAALAAELERMIDSCAGGRVGQCTVMATLNDHALCAAEDHALEAGPELFGERNP